MTLILTSVHVLHLANSRTRMWRISVQVSLSDLLPEHAPTCRFLEFFSSGDDPRHLPAISRFQKMSALVSYLRCTCHLDFHSGTVSVRFQPCRCAFDHVCLRLEALLDHHLAIPLRSPPRGREPTKPHPTKRKSFTSIDRTHIQLNISGSRWVTIVLLSVPAPPAPRLPSTLQARAPPPLFRIWQVAAHQLSRRAQASRRPDQWFWAADGQVVLCRRLWQEFCPLYASLEADFTHRPASRRLRSSSLI
ncbi:hypothetical protein K438DRAFT_800943 [Mycena galopus ATCC 62051]|nr:hypothetical protein K438DRAFT_800943 [Mycena galopus ATCC 62051]